MSIRLLSLRRIPLFVRRCNRYNGRMLQTYNSSFRNVHRRNFASVTFTITREGEESVEVTAEEGASLLDVCQDWELEVEGACGGECCCSTCHVYLPQDLFDSLGEVDEDEEDMLELAVGLRDTSRLGCQVKVTPAFEGQTLELPKEVSSQLG